MKRKGTRPSLFKNIAYLVSGNGAAAALGFLALVINAHNLGPSGIGILAVLQAYILVVTRLCSFDTWQLVINLGTPPLSTGDHSTLRDVAVVAFAYDTVGALIATVASFALSPFASAVLGLPPAGREYLSIMSLAVIVSGAGCAVGLLRMFGEFKFLATVHMAVAALSVVLAIALAQTQADLELYIYGLTALNAITPIATVIYALVVWQRRCLPPLSKGRFSNKSVLRSSAKFTRSTWTMSSINSLRQNADVFVLSALLGPTASGIYKVCAQLASLILKVFDPFSQVFYPIITELHSRGRIGRLKRMIYILACACMAITVLFSVVAYTAGSDLLRMLYGNAFSGGAACLAWLVLANSLSVNQTYIRPTMFALHGARTYLLVFIASVAMFVPTLYLSTNKFGIDGAGISQVAFNALWFACSLFLISRTLRLSPKKGYASLGQLLKVLLRLNRIRRLRYKSDQRV